MAPAFAEGALVELGARFQARSGLPLGADRHGL
jgi:hypothetical protein